MTDPWTVAHALYDAGWALVKGREEEAKRQWAQASQLYDDALAGMPRRYWHAYQAEIPPTLEEALGPAVAFTVIADCPLTAEEAPRVHHGTVFAHELTFTYLTTWDHEPTEAEKGQAQLAQFQLAKEKEEQ